jgi:hypothetical protein
VARTAAALAIATTIALGALAPAAGARERVTVFKLTEAQGSVRVAFAGDQAAGCAERGVCGVSGTTSYTFGGTPRFGDLHFFRSGPGDSYALGVFETRARTTSEVGTAGSPERCVDQVPHSLETLALEPRRGALDYLWRGLSARDFADDSDDRPSESRYGADPFDTRCAGPSLHDVVTSGALPAARVPYRILRSKRSRFRTRGRAPLRAGGFAGTVEWDMTYRLAWRSCNPRCRNSTIVVFGD